MEASLSRKSEGRNIGAVPAFHIKSIENTCLYVRVQETP